MNDNHKKKNKQRKIKLSLFSAIGCIITIISPIIIVNFSDIENASLQSNLSEHITSTFSNPAPQISRNRTDGQKYLYNFDLSGTINVMQGRIQHAFIAYRSSDKHSISNSDIYQLPIKSNEKDIFSTAKVHTHLKNKLLKSFPTNSLMNQPITTINWKTSFAFASSQPKLNKAIYLITEDSEEHMNIFLIGAVSEYRYLNPDSVSGKVVLFDIDLERAFTSPTSVSVFSKERFLKTQNRLNTQQENPPVSTQQYEQDITEITKISKVYFSDKP